MTTPNRQLAGHRWPRFAFRTIDRLVAVAEVPDADGGTPPAYLMRPCEPFPPLISGVRDGFNIEYRKYELTADTHDGLPVYQEKP